MPLVFQELHPASSPELVNEEWLVLENTGPQLVNVAGCQLTVAEKGQRPRALGTLQPGFVLASGQRIRVVTGSPSKKAWGTPPTEEAELKNYYLFLREPILGARPRTLCIAAHQRELARAEWPVAAAPPAAAPPA